MTLPDLTDQSLYLDVSWGVVVSALIVALLGVGRSRRVVGRGGIAAICALVFVCMWLPGAMSPSFWLGLAFQYPSPLLVGLCGLHIVRAVRSSPDRPGTHLLPLGPAATLTALGLLLYAGTFLWLPYDVYQYGYRGFAAAGATTVLVVFWWRLWPSSGAVCAVAASAAFLHTTTRLPSGNAWDALLDPLLFSWAATTTLIALLTPLRRRIATTVRGTMGTALVGGVSGGGLDSPWARDASIVVGAGVVLYAALAALPTRIVERVSDEHGPVETATVVLILAAGVLSVLAARRGTWRSGYLAAAIFAAAAMRELDFHKQFTSRSITRGAGVGFLASPVVPGVEKVVVVLLGMALLTVVIAFLAREWTGFRLGFRMRSRPVMLVVVGLVLLCGAVVLDDTHATVKRLGVEIAARWELLEELLEMQAAATFVLALLPPVLASWGPVRSKRWG